MAQFNLPPAFLALAAFACVGVPLSSYAQTPPGTAAPTKPKENSVTFGNGNIHGFKRSTFRLNSSDVHFLGSDIVLDAQDKSGQTRLHLIANDMVKTGVKGHEKADISGNVRYTLTRNSPDGTQVLEGTAARAVCEAAGKVVTLSGSVQARLTDPLRLNGPAALQSTNLTVYLNETPYRIEMSGSPDATLVRVQPRSETKPDRVQTLIVRGFREGAFQTGKSALFTGGNPVLEFAQPKQQMRGTLRAARLEATFTPAGLASASATGSVRAQVVQEGTDGPRSAIGQGDRATYDAANAQMIVSGDVQATITNPATLQGPATLTANRVVIHNAVPQRVEITGTAAQTRLNFTPKNAAPVAANPPASKLAAAGQGVVPPKARVQGGKTNFRPFAAGTVNLSGFTSAVYEPGKDVQVVGDDSLFVTNDAATQTRTRLQATRFVGRFDDTNALSQTQAIGNVRYEIVQPTASKKATQTVRGTAVRAVYANGDAGQTVDVIGPLKATIISPETLDAPGTAQGFNSGDVLHLNLTTQEFAFDSEQQTALLNLPPPDPDKATKPVPTQGKKKPAKPLAKLPSDPKPSP